MVEQQQVQKTSYKDCDKFKKGAKGGARAMQWLLKRMKGDEAKAEPLLQGNADAVSVIEQATRLCTASQARTG